MPAGATRIDGRGKFLMPGVAEMHAHIPGGQAPDALIASRAGVVRRQRRDHHPRHAGRSDATCRCATRVAERRDRDRPDDLHLRRAKLQRQHREVARDCGEDGAGPEGRRLRPAEDSPGRAARSVRCRGGGGQSARDRVRGTRARGGRPRARAVEPSTTPSITSMDSSSTRCGPAPPSTEEPGILRGELRGAPRSRADEESGGGHQGGRRVDRADAGLARDLHEPGHARRAAQEPGRRAACRRKWWTAG